MKTFRDDHGKSWEAYPYGAEASGEADGPPPSDARMIAFDHPSRAESTTRYTTALPEGARLDELSASDLRELLALAEHSES